MGSHILSGHFLFMCVTTSVVTGSAAHLDGVVNGSTKFTAIWNVPTFLCGKKFGIHIDVSQYGIESNAGDRFRGDTITILYQNQLGLYPWINGEGTFVNGGLPQLSNLEYHLDKTADDIDRWIPDENFSGAAIIDWERWRPIFVRNGFNREQQVYIDESEHVVRQVHPDWSDDRIRRQAETDFESAARNFMQKTLELCRSKRPRGRWGYYGFPECYNRHPGESSCAASIVAENNELSWMFESSSAIYPSIYLEEGFGTHEDRYWQVHGILEESLRVKGRFAKPTTPILVYTRYRYGNMGDFYDNGDLNNTIQQSFNTKLDGVIFWDSSKSLKTEHNCELLNSYVSKTLGPYAKHFTNPPNYSEKPGMDLANGYESSMLTTIVQSTLQGGDNLKITCSWTEWALSWKTYVFDFIEWIVVSPAKHGST